jgi:NadR type nicotinamide-nucleotide adenylyltransferase
MIKRIAITGPESTGKSWLSKRLAEYFDTVWVEEYVREYLELNGVNYHYEDILRIAEGQKAREDMAINKANKLLFSDTEPIVTKIWSEVVYSKCDPWIENEIATHPYDLYLICYPDLPWEPDPLRENPDNRLELFELYLEELSTKGYNFKIVKGVGEERLKNAVRFVKDIL